MQYKGLIFMRLSTGRFKSAGKQWFFCAGFFIALMGGKEGIE